MYLRYKIKQPEKEGFWTREIQLGNGRKNNWNLIRLLLALTVFMVHTGPAHLVTFIQGTLGLSFVNGSTAVYLFFITSGFLITSSLLDNNELGLYFKRRLLRIYPPLIFAAAIVFTSELYFNAHQATYLISISNFLLFQDLGSLPPEADVFRHPAFWTLVIEMQFYIILPIFIYAYFKLPMRSLIFLFTIYIISRFLFDDVINVASIYSAAFRTSIFAHASFFITGIVLRIFVTKISTYDKYSTLAIFVVFLLIESAYIHIFPSRFHQLMGPIYLGILLLACAIFAPVVRWPFPDISYGIYIYHPLTNYILSMLIPYNIIVQLGPSIHASIMLFCCVTVSLFSYYFIESKCIKLGKAKA